MKNISTRRIIALLGACICLIALLGGGTLAQTNAQDKPPLAEQAMKDNSLRENLLYWASDKIYGRVGLKDYHKKIHQNGANCELCHGVKEPTGPADTKNCSNCHGTPADVAKLWETKHKDDKEHTINPHDSPHWEKDIPCDMCHREHGQSKLYCKTCHHFEYKVP
ncbi:cytochrome c3 family protein [Desulfocurvus sp. DL9XJH121]